MLFIAFIACFSVCLAQGPRPIKDKAWQNWKLEFGKVYSAEEEPTKYDNWKKSREEVALNNANYESTYETGLNEFSDMTQEEFEAVYLTGLEVPEDTKNGTAAMPLMHEEAAYAYVPNSVNWVDKGYVTGVKNQGRCGSCYSFAATGSLEGQWFKKTGKLVSMSEQQLVDCSTSYGNHGCHGGWYHSCWKYIRDAGGIDSEQAYKYYAVQGRCWFDKKYIVAHATGSVSVRKSEDALKSALATVGPIAVAISAGRPGFRSYKRGVFYDPQCSQRVTHAVLAVGYGSESGMDYWLVKNSWGTRWGAGGYIKMARNKGNMCAIASYAAYPSV